MAEILTDDELDLTEAERKRKPRPQAIGSPIMAPDESGLLDEERPQPQPHGAIGGSIAGSRVPVEQAMIPTSTTLATPRTEAIGAPIQPVQDNEALIRMAGGMHAGPAPEPSHFSTDEPLTEPKPQAIGEPIQLREPYAQRPAYERYEKLSSEQRKPWSDLGIGGKIGRVAEGIGSAIVPGPVSMIPGTELHHERQLHGARTAAEEENKEIGNIESEKFERARTEEQRGLAEQARARAAALRQGKPERTGSPEADAYYSLRDQGKTPEEALEIVKGAGKQDRPVHSTAFEAFAYGTPEEKQAAQDFLEYEKKIGARYRTPNEFDLRYKLYREDPDTYKAMFGDKGEAADERARVADRAHATAMLRFFEKQRDEISKNFMLGDDEKRQKLTEIDELEKPFKEAATAAPGGGKGDRVNVVSPDGTPGTIPRSQLGKAKAKGYKEAPAQ